MATLNKLAFITIRWAWIEVIMNLIISIWVKNCHFLTSVTSANTDHDFFGGGFQVTKYLIAAPITWTPNQQLVFNVFNVSWSVLFLLISEVLSSLLHVCKALYLYYSLVPCGLCVPTGVLSLVCTLTRSNLRNDAVLIPIYFNIQPSD